METAEQLRNRIIVNFLMQSSQHLASQVFKLVVDIVFVGVDVFVLWFVNDLPAGLQCPRHISACCCHDCLTKDRGSP